MCINDLFPENSRQNLNGSLDHNYNIDISHCN